MYNQAKASFYTHTGPVFTNFLLSDEINRAPAKVQSALLEAMQERQVTIGNETLPLPTPFIVLATQNPLEQEGTYPLPEAQLDRFLLKTIVHYPTREEEIEIMKRMTHGDISPISEILTIDEIIAIQKVAREEVFVDEKIYTYIAEIIEITRDPKKYNCTACIDYIEF